MLSKDIRITSSSIPGYRLYAKTADQRTVGCNAHTKGVTLPQQTHVKPEDGEVRNPLGETTTTSTEFLTSI